MRILSAHLNVFVLKDGLVHFVIKVSIVVLYKGMYILSTVLENLKYWSKKYVSFVGKIRVLSTFLCVGDEKIIVLSPS